jgi:hypothetical protein
MSSWIEGIAGFRRVQRPIPKQEKDVETRGREDERAAEVGWLLSMMVVNL